MLSTMISILGLTLTAQAASFSPEELGTPGGVVRLQAVADHATLQQAIEQAMPRFSADKLSTQLQALGRDRQALAAATGQLALLDEGAQQASRKPLKVQAGQLQFSRAERPTGVLDLPLAEGQRQQASMAARHQQFLQQLGVPRRNMLPLHSVLLAQQVEAIDTPSPSMQPKLYGYLSIATRSAGGLIVEDQQARLSSNRKGQLRSVQLHWPQIRLSTATQQGLLRPRPAVLEELATRIGPQASKSSELRMAVVLRPQQGLYRPALRVGLTPHDGQSAGEVFYVDLSNEAS